MPAKNDKALRSLALELTVKALLQPCTVAEVLTTAHAFYEFLSGKTIMPEK